MDQPLHSILTIAPYRILPANSGGRLGIVMPHHFLAQRCEDHVVSTADNPDNDEYAFTLHKLLGTGAKRYIPYAGMQALLEVAHRHRVQAVICEHPYMALTVMKLAKRLGVPWYLRSHNIESDRFRTLGKKWWPVMARYEGYAMRKATGNFFVTPEDADWAVRHYRVDPSRCHHIPYGSLLSTPPGGHAEAKTAMAAETGLDPHIPWLYFLGTLDYLPNTDAVRYILDEIMPRLQKAGLPCQVLIAGKGLPETLQEQIRQSGGKVRYMGFVPDLDVFLKACDVMLNPVLTGGGIKTKAVEAIGYGKVVVSSHSGALGIPPAVCGGNLYISGDHDWDAFCADVIRQSARSSIPPPAFYDMFYWGNIADKIVSIISGH